MKNRLRLAELINNLLEFTQIRLGGGLSINKATLDLTIQSEKIIQELQLAYPEANMIIQSPGPVKGQWDRIRLDQLMTNLITNAIRYGTPGGPVKVKIYDEGNDAFFEVHNEGPVIPKKIQDKIFTGKFTKSNKDFTNDESYGLGLYIVKEIVDGHKGEIELTSTREKGTVFKVSLPKN